MRIDERTVNAVPDPFFIVSFYTSGPDGRGYETYADQWLKGLEQHGHRHQAVLVDIGGTDDWRSGALAKPAVISHILKRGHPVLWIDIDAIVRGRLELDIDTDMASNWRDENHGYAPTWPSGTLYFNPTGCSKHLLDLWTRHAKDAAENLGSYKGVAGDQEILGFLATDMIDAGMLTHTEIERKWCFVFDIDRHFGYRDPLIEHFQASRGKKLGNSIQRLICTKLPKGAKPCHQ